MPSEPTARFKSKDRRLDERPSFEGLCQWSDRHTIEHISTRRERHVRGEAETLHADLLVVFVRDGCEGECLPSKLGPVALIRADGSLRLRRIAPPS